jgi:hypothetical protein
MMMHVYVLLTVIGFVGFDVLLGSGVRRCGLAILPWVVLSIEWFVAEWLFPGPQRSWPPPPRGVGWVCLGSLIFGALINKAIVSRLSHGLLLNLVLITALLAHFTFWRWFWYQTYFFSFVRGLLTFSIIAALAWLGAFLLLTFT